MHDVKVHFYKVIVIIVPSVLPRFYIKCMYMYLIALPTCACKFIVAMAVCLIVNLLKRPLLV